MNTEHLVSMANQIGSFFESYPDQVEACDEIAGHLQKYWAPRMRSQLLDHVDHKAGDGLQQMVLSSIRTHRHKLEPRADFQASPAIA